MKKGISLSVLSVIIVIMVILTTTVTTTGSMALSNSKKMKFASEIAFVQEMVDKYINDKILKDNSDIYYYEVVNKGLFKKKEVYMINMYDKKVYVIDSDGISNY